MRIKSYSRLLLVFLGVLLFATVTYSKKQKDESGTGPDPLRFKKEIDAFIEWDSRNSVPADAILFVGSSSIRLWATHDCFGDMTVINRGFGGSHIWDVNYFAESIVLPYKPKVIVFYAGDNDIAGKKSPKRVLKDYQSFVKLVGAKLPNTSIVFIAIKPSQARWSLWGGMKEANSMIRDFSSGDDKLFFVDTSVALLDSTGKPDKRFFLEDGLHFNEAGYKIWTGMIRPVIIAASSNTGRKS